MRKSVAKLASHCWRRECVVCSPDERGWRRDTRQVPGHLIRLVLAKRREVLQESPSSAGCCKRTQVLIDGVSTAFLICIAVHEVRVNGTEQQSSWNSASEGQKGTCQCERTGDNDIEPNRIDEAQSAYADRMVNRHRLSHAAPEVMPDERRVLDSERVHERHQPLGVTMKREIGRSGLVASSESEQIQHHHAVPFRQERNQFAPNVTGRREAVYKNDGLAGSPGPGSVVVKADAANVYEFAAHACRVSLPDKVWLYGAGKMRAVDCPNNTCVASPSALPERCYPYAPFHRVTTVQWI